MPRSCEMYVVHPHANGSRFVVRKVQSPLFGNDLRVVFDGPDVADRTVAATLGHAFAEEVTRLAGVGKTECFGEGILDAWRDRFAADAQHLYVRIARAPATASPPSPWPSNFAEGEWIAANAPSDQWHVLPCLPQPAVNWGKAKARMPSAWHVINGAFYDSDPRTLIPSIMARVGLAPEENRVFLSYRRNESQQVAEQLFDALTHRGFDVFLDRFSLDPGSRCQESIMQDIDDKALVVLLNTPEVFAATSAWVESEISRARLYRLGLFVVQFPSTKPRTDLTPDGIEHLSANSFDAPTTAPPFGRLTSTSLDGIVKQIQRVHTTSVHRRRYELHDTLATMLRVGRKSWSPLPGGGFVCRAKSGERVIIAVSPRPPGLFEFFGLHDRGGMGTPTTACEGLIVSPAPFIVARRKAGVNWLGGVCDIRHVDEGQLSDLVAQLQ